MPKIMLDKERDLRLTYGIMRQFRDKFKRNLISEGISKIDEWSIEEHEELMYLLLSRDDPKITREDVEKVCDYPSIARIIISVFTGETPKGQVIKEDPLGSGGPGARSIPT